MTLVQKSPFSLQAICQATRPPILVNPVLKGVGLVLKTVGNAIGEDLPKKNTILTFPSTQIENILGIICYLCAQNGPSADGGGDGIRTHDTRFHV
ncbi:MAG: hypothetical protein JSR85_00960 [Proteobacteria bacterium]|nr:hypothetical protein [Pseudomonadota bacterium]